MNVNVFLSGVVLFLVFEVFQVERLDSPTTLGTTAWLVGVLVFSGVLWFIGKSVMPKQSNDMKTLWMFAFLFLVVFQVVISYLGPYLGAVFPSQFLPAALTPLVISLWLIVFGGAMFVTGWWSKNGVTSLIGIIWLLTSTYF